MKKSTETSKSASSGTRLAPKGKTGQSLDELEKAWGAGKESGPHLTPLSVQPKTIPGGLTVVQDTPEPRPRSQDQTQGVSDWLGVCT